MRVPEDRGRTRLLGLVLPTGPLACEARSSGDRGGGSKAGILSQKPGYLSWKTTPQSLWLGSGSPLALPLLAPKCPEPFPGQLLPQDVGVWLAAISTTSALGTMQAQGC